MKKERKYFTAGIAFLSAFALWTVLVRTVDVQPAGPQGSLVGFASLNCRFHQLTGTNMTLYTVTDWLGLVPLAVCMAFAVTGLVQLIKRRSLFKVDKDILILGIYYAAVIAAYFIFEMIPVNYRPVLISGYLEASYPSSTTLLVLCTMPTLAEQISRREHNTSVKRMTYIFTVIFSVFMVAGRLLSGVHWLTDIAGAVLLSAGMFLIYMGFVQKEKNIGI